MMRLPVILTLMICICVPVYADGMYVPRIDQSSVNADIREPAQKAVISYFDNEEQMILQVTYKGRAKNFAWLIPTPSKPDVKLSYPEVFEALAEATAPRVHYWFGADKQLRNLSFAKSRGVEEHASVDVIERKKVGRYDVSVLKAQNAADLILWLRANRYNVTPAIENIISEYIKKGWVFTAARIDTSIAEGDSEVTDEGELNPLYLKFASASPVYPLKISSINKGKTNLLLYVVARHRVTADNLRVRCVLNNKDKKGGEYLYNEAFNMLGHMLPDKYYSQGVFITKLSGNLAPSDMVNDIYFDRARTDTTLHPQIPAPFIENLGATGLFAISYPIMTYPPATTFISVACIIGAFFVKNRMQDALLWIGFCFFISPAAMMFGTILIPHALMGVVMIAAPCWWGYRIFSKGRANKAR